jgi:hypothetical protein
LNAGNPSFGTGKKPTPRPDRLFEVDPTCAGAGHDRALPQDAGEQQTAGSRASFCRAFLKTASNWSGSYWVLDESGLASFVNLLTVNYRNPAAHITELGQAEYTGCRDLVLGADGGFGSF